MRALEVVAQQAAAQAVVPPVQPLVLPVQPLVLPVLPLVPPVVRLVQPVVRVSGAVPLVAQQRAPQAMVQQATARE